MLVKFKDIKKYFINYVCAYKWIKMFLLPAICILGIVNFLEIFTLKESAKFVKINRSNDKWVLSTIIMCIMMYTFLKFIADTFSTYMVSYITQKAYTDFFGEFLNITYSEFHKYGIGEKHFDIRRRAVAISMFFSALTINFVVNLMFFIWVTFEVCSKLNFFSFIKILSALTMFLIAIFLLQSLRANLRIKVIQGFEENSKKMYDVLFNYERIVAYNNEEIELRKYYKSMSNQCFYNKLFWVTFEVGNFVTDALFCFLSIFIFLEYSKQSFATPKEAAEAAAILTSIVKSLETKVKFMAKIISVLVMHYTNFDESIVKNAQKENNERSTTLILFEKDVKCSDLKFKHNKRIILNGVNISIMKGDKIALVGTNGCGKSTFLKLLLGFYIYDGKIEIDDHDYKSLGTKQIRDMYSYIPQDSQLFDVSVLDNIKMGNKSLSNEEIVSLCIQFGYHKLFKTIGYDFNVGSRGKKISGGERQKIAFMRAVARKAPLMLMDEPTANLDKNSEKIFIEHIKSKLETKTVLMIVHNLETLRYFDKVYFFNNKTIEAIGTFDDLYSKHNNFKKFYNSALSKQNKI